MSKYELIEKVEELLRLIELDNEQSIDDASDLASDIANDLLAASYIYGEDDL